MIIGILAAALIPKIQRAEIRARNVKRKYDIHTLSTAIASYRLFNWVFPVWLWALQGDVLTSTLRDPSIPHMQDPCRTPYNNLWTLLAGMWPWWWWFADRWTYDFAWLTTSLVSYSGYLYHYSQELKFGIVYARMEKDWSKNSHSFGGGQECSWASNNGGNLAWNQSLKDTVEQKMWEWLVADWLFYIGLIK